MDKVRRQEIKDCINELVKQYEKLGKIMEDEKQYLKSVDKDDRKSDHYMASTHSHGCLEYGHDELAGAINSIHEATLSLNWMGEGVNEEMYVIYVEGLDDEVIKATTPRLLLEIEQPLKRKKWWATAKVSE